MVLIKCLLCAICLHFIFALSSFLTGALGVGGGFEIFSGKTAGIESVCILVAEK